jgi:hypothetical protein
MRARHEPAEGFITQLKLYPQQVPAVGRPATRARPAALSTRSCTCDARAALGRGGLASSERGRAASWAFRSCQRSGRAGLWCPPPRPLPPPPPSPTSRTVVAMRKCSTASTLPPQIDTSSRAPGRISVCAHSRSESSGGWRNTLAVQHLPDAVVHEHRQHVDAAQQERVRPGPPARRQRAVPRRESSAREHPACMRGSAWAICARFQKQFRLSHTTTRRKPEGREGFSMIISTSSSAVPPPSYQVRRRPRGIPRVTPQIEAPARWYEQSGKGRSCTWHAMWRCGRRGAASFWRSRGRRGRAGALARYGDD